MKRFNIFQIFISLFCVLILQLQLDAQSNKKVLFFDDFTNANLDRSKWNVIITGDHFNDELQAYIDSASTLFVENGCLVFRPQYSPGFITKDGKRFDFTSARITTQNKFDFAYGTAEAKIKQVSPFEPLRAMECVELSRGIQPDTAIRVLEL